MADEKHIEILRLGVEAWNIWYNATWRGFANLQGASFRCVDLAGANLTGARLQDADFRYANLSGADLRGADFTGAHLERANLRDARLSSATGLTQQQLNCADGNDSTDLPDGFDRPQHWSYSESVQDVIFEYCTVI